MKNITYVAFTYPFSYREVQLNLSKLEKKYSTRDLDFETLRSRAPESIYFHREKVCNSYEGRRIDLITISGVNNVINEREPHLENLFPPDDVPKLKEISDSSLKPWRPFKFRNKKIVFISARVHPGETQSSFVFNGFVKFLLRESDPRAVKLRQKYVFKLIPMLNPDGVVNGHYR